MAPSPRWTTAAPPVAETDAGAEGGPGASASRAADGVISSAVEGFGEMSAAERKQLAADLTKKSSEDRCKIMDQELSYQAAAIFRTRVIVAQRVEQACTLGERGGANISCGNQGVGKSWSQQCLSAAQECLRRISLQLLQPP